MKSLIYKLIITGVLMILMVVLTACSDDFLSTNPIGSVSQTTLANEQGADGMLMAAYSLLNGCGSSGGDIWSSKSVHSTMASDEAFAGSQVSGDNALYEGYNHGPSDLAMDARWRFLYAAVQRSNDVLRILGYENVEIPEDVAQQIRAEAIFLRGVYHLEAIMTYGNIPYVDETITFANGNYNIRNDTPAWPHIEEDFQYAVNHLDETKSEPGRANSWAAKSYLAKTYMFQAKFSEALPLLTDIIENGVTANGLVYDLNEEYHHNFNTEHANGPEAVFAIQMSVQPSGNNGNCADHGNGPYGGGAVAYGWTQPSFEMGNIFQTDENTGLPLLETYHETPIRTDQGLASSDEFIPHEGTLDPRIDWTLGRRGVPYLDYGVNPGRAWIRVWTTGGPYSAIKHVNWAYRPEDRNGNNTNTPYNLIRFADVLLWAAEAEVEVGSLAQAEIYVNRVRERAANPEGFLKKYLDDNDPQGGFSNEPAANYYVGLYSGQFEQHGEGWAREAVRFERRLELGMEHHRFFDLQRYNLVDEGYMAETLNTYLERMREVPNYFNDYLDDGFFTQGKNEIYAIPQPQIDLSIDPETGESVLIQNPGY